MPTHRCRQQASIHPGSVETPRITDRIELGEVKYPREAVGVQSGLLVKVECTGISSQIRTKLFDWAVRKARAGCYMT